MLKRFLTLILVVLVGGPLIFAQKSVPIRRSNVTANSSSGLDGQVSLEWQGVIAKEGVDGSMQSYLLFHNAYPDPKTHLPKYHQSKKLPRGAGSATVRILPTEVKPVTAEERLFLASKKLPEDFNYTSTIRKSGRDVYAVIDLEPIRRRGNSIEKLMAFQLEVTPDYTVGRDGGRDEHWVNNSVLASGEWYKIRTGQDGVHRVTYSFLRACGFNVNGLSSSAIRLYGTPAGMLTMDNDLPRTDDLNEIPIEIHDGGDGSFDPGDYFLFYGEDQVVWKRNVQWYAHQVNYYTDSVSYFLTTTGGTGLPQRITNQTGSLSANTTSNFYDYYDYHEVESSNLIQSGREWYGEQLGIVPSYDFGFTVPAVDQSSEARVIGRFAVRSVSINGCGITMSLPNQGGLFDTLIVGSVSSSYASLYARKGAAEIEFFPTGGDFLTKVAIRNDNNPSAQAWVNDLEVNARRRLTFLGPTMNFRDAQSIGVGNVCRFNIQGAPAGLRVWEVTDVHQVKSLNVQGSTANGYYVVSPTGELREFVAFVESGLLTPSRSGRVENQNLHSLSGIQYLIITHPQFRSQAEQLAQFHEEEDGFTTAVVDVGDIYNEFSGGSQDITAIREFIRMLYHRNIGTPSALQYLCLFGDASYDYKDRISGNSNYVPSYQTAESLFPPSSVVSDDYFGLLDEDETESPADLVDISIGRLTARSRNEAQRMVDKILHYSRNPNTLGDWRNWVTLVADDPEGRRAEFQNQCDDLADLADSLNPIFNIRKIYLDAYKQQTGSGGARYPDAAEDITERTQKGSLMTYYIGHGGELGWAHERILEVPTINKWTNLDNLPLFITATCEFARFDDPRRTSAGEYVLLNPSGGGVALLTTTRAVYSDPNFKLTFSFTREAFDVLEEAKPRLGDMCRQTKIENATLGIGGYNTRCFHLLGDPAMALAFPRERVIIDSMPDTLRALEKVRITGFVANRDSQLIESFNGLVYPTLFDKVSLIQGQNNDGEGLYFYEERRNILFRGKSSVTNGRFAFEFVVPKDIDKTLGGGKLSLYAENGEYDANGANFDHLIGGISANPIQDDEGPQVDLYMNDNSFVFGGITNEDPDLYAEVFDENGVNMVGTGVGHDITAVLDGKGANTLILNDYYEANVDSYQRGKIRYPLKELEEGRHTLKLQVWDVNNNPGEAYTEFIVANDEEFVLDHVLNYPNPFTTNTDFYFEHNKPGLNLDVRIEVFTVSGKLIKTIDGDYSNDGFRVGPINWNGKDEYGDILAKGVYLYRLSVRTPTGDQAEEYERLVILK